MDRPILSIRLLIAALICALLGALPARGQNLGARQLAESTGPRFIAADAAGHVYAATGEVRNAAVFRRRIRLDLKDARVTDAIDSIARAGRVSITFDPTVLGTAGHVSLASSDITIGAALIAVLFDAGVDVALAQDGTHMALVPRTRSAPRSVDQRQPPTVGAVVGRVTDAKTGEPLANVTVVVHAAPRGITTGLDGRYVVRALAVGHTEITFRRLGYTTAVRTAEVSADSATRLDVALAPSALVLDQVVTTVTGEQRLRTIGNAISTINADSLVPTTPVNTLGDVLNARAAGVQVINQGGVTGASPLIYIRGNNSLNLSSQPIVYIDGVRVDNSAAQLAPYQSLQSLQSGRLDDVQPEDIASIEIVKGPSAATLYGTDAANGVILITTKHGVAGRTRWSAYAEGGALTVNPDQIRPSETGWGHTPSGQITNACTLVAVGAGQCVQDSITSFTPLRVPSLTPFGTGNRGEGGLQVSGGNGDTRYFASGAYASEVGYLTLPVAERPILDSILGSVANEQEHPNALTKYSARVTLTQALGRSADANLSAGFVSQDSRIPVSQALESGEYGNGYRDQYDGWGYGVRPYEFFGSRNDESAQHFTGSGTAHWVPASWLTARATAGVDLSNLAYDELTPPGLTSLAQTGERADTRGSIGLYSVDLGATAKLPLVGGLTSSTSGGVQYHRQSTYYAIAKASNLLVGGSTVESGISSSSETDQAQVVAGAYGEEQLGLNDRLFLTGAVRVDGANDFGVGFRSAVYPKASVSWLVSQEPFFPHIPLVDLIRLRAAFGESGTQPGLSLTTFTIQSAAVDGGTTPGATFNSIGNPNLQPERQVEWEGGADVDLLHQRAHLEFTYYTKKNTNALYAVPVGSSIGVGVLEENIGEIWNWGYEALANLTVLKMSALTWDITLNGSINHNQVLTLGPYFQPSYGLYGMPSIVAGYPIYSNFDLPYTYRDLNHDGIIEPNEVTLGTTPRYYGATLPSEQASIGTSFGLFHDRVRLSALFDYRGGYRIANTILGAQCFTGCFASLDRHASLAQQAGAVASNFLSPYPITGFYSDGEYWRFRELSLTWSAPVSIAERIGARTLSVTLAARNLAIWSRYSGGDPETNSAIGVPQQGPFEPGGYPPAQYWLLRLNLGF